MVLNGGPSPLAVAAAAQGRGGRRSTGSPPIARGGAHSTRRPRPLRAGSAGGHGSLQVRMATPPDPLPEPHQDPSRPLQTPSRPPSRAPADPLP
eukprot:3643926-Pyramimonas_sp.AAC.2